MQHSYITKTLQDTIFRRLDLQELLIKYRWSTHWSFFFMPRWTQLKPNTLTICEFWLNVQTWGKHSWEACVPQYTHTLKLAGRYWDPN